MTSGLVVLFDEYRRKQAARTCMVAPAGTRVEFLAPKRTLPQNNKMWASLTDISHVVPWHGVKLVPNDWKLIFLDALGREMRIVPNLDNTGFVNLGQSSSRLSKEEMANLITLIQMFGDKYNVWREIAAA